MSMPRPLRALLVEDRADDAELLLIELQRAGYAAEWQRVETEADFRAALHPDLDIILSDFALPTLTGLRALEVLRERGLEIPFILISGTIGEDTAVEAIKHGAADYLLKDRLGRLAPAIHQALEQGRLRRERKEAGVALQESERRFRELLENVEMIAIILDENGVVTFCNDFLARTTGWSREEVIGWDWFSNFAPGSPDVRALYFRTIEAGGNPPKNENPIKTRSGALRDIVWNSTLLRNPAGGVIGMACIGEDITERKRSEERLREQAAMLNQTHEAIIVRNIHSRRITFWNPGAERLYGWTAAEAEGRDIGELIFVDPEAPNAVSEHLLETGEWRGEQQHVSKAGQPLTVSGHATLVSDAKGRPQSVLVIVIDITEQKNLEAQLLRAQRMESLGTLAAGVAHDLNNILAPILLTTPMLRGEMTEELKEELLLTIEMSAERGAQIVKQVLTFGAGLEGERQALRLESLIRELTKIMRETFPKNLKIESRLEPRLWAVRGDATQIHQVLLNLCVNARDAMPDGGKLSLHAANLDLDAHFAGMLPEAAPGPHVLIEVSDTGSGIPPEIVERIFDPFFTTKGPGKGTGLGLSTVHGIVKSHGGAIKVLSELRGGSTFQVYLPAAPAPEPAPPPLSDQSLSRGAGELVLVVDDEEVICGATRTALEAAGYRVLLAPNGVEGLAAFALNGARVSAVITDLMMPLMDGLALTRALRAMRPSLPIIASTGLGERAQIADLKAMNVHAILTKPYGIKALLRAVHAALHPKAATASS